MIKVFDGLVPDDLIEEVHTICSQMSYIANERDSESDSLEERTFVANVPMNNQAFYRLRHLISDSVSKTIDPDQFLIERAYVNCFMKSDSPKAHVDSMEPDTYTVLYYANNYWHHDFAGETIFLDAHNEIVKSVLPKPGRFVIFDSRILHSARVQTNNGPKFRYTMALKLSKKRLQQWT